LTLEIVAKIESIGGQVSLEGDRLKVRIPESYPEADALVEELRARKGEIIRLLQHREDTCAGCYSLGVYGGQERFIHPPKLSQDWLDWLEKWQPKGRTQ